MTQKIKEKSELVTIDTTSPRVRMVNRLMRLHEEKKNLGCVGCNVGPELAIKNLADINKKIETCRDAMYLYDLRNDVTECLTRMIGLNPAEARKAARLGISLENAGGVLEQNTLTNEEGVTIVLPTHLVISIAQGLAKQLSEGKKDLVFPKDPNQ